MAIIGKRIFLKRIAIASTCLLRNQVGKICSVTRDPRTYKVEEEIPFYQKKGILFQFILHEFLKSTSLIDQLLTQRDSSLFSQLLGNHSTPLITYALSPPLSYRPGALFKLQYYFSLFHPKDESMENIFLSIQKAFKMAEKSFHLSLNHPTFFEEFTLLSKLMKKIALLLFKMIPSFSEDENVLFFLLEHQNEIEKTSGKKFLLSVIKKVFKGGTSEMASFLYYRYSQRGFDHILPHIHRLIHNFDSTYVPPL